MAGDDAKMWSPGYSLSELYKFGGPNGTRTLLYSGIPRSYTCCLIHLGLSPIVDRGLDLQNDTRPSKPAVPRRPRRPGRREVPRARPGPATGADGGEAGGLSARVAPSRRGTDMAQVFDVARQMDWTARGSRPAPSRSTWISSSRSAQAEPGRDRVEVQVRVAHVERGCADAFVEEMQRVLLAVADGAHDLMAAPGHAQARLGGVGLRGGDRAAGVRPARLDPPRGLPREPARALDVAEEIGTRVLHGLVRPDRPRALHAHPGVLQAQLEHALRGAHHLGAPGEGASVEGWRQQLPAATGRAEEIVRPCLRAGERELEQLVAGHALEGVRLDAAAVHRQQERGRPRGSAA